MRPHWAKILRRLSPNVKNTIEGVQADGNVLTDKFIRSLSSFPIFENKIEYEPLNSSIRFINITRHIRICDVKKYSKKVGDQAKNVMHFYEFSDIEEKDRDSFIGMISMYEEKFKSRKGVVDFILAALKHMKEFGVAEDLEVYKRLADLMPKGPYVPTNRLQIDMLHFRREQECLLDLLNQMEENSVMPDPDMGDILTSIFGEIGIPTRKFYRMMYWMPKFRHRGPWLVPRPLPKETFTLAKLAIERITSVDLQTEITVFRTEDVEESLEKTWIVSGQSPIQKELLKKHNLDKPLIVEGGDHVYLRDKRIKYFVLKSEEVPFVDEPPEDKNDISDLKIKFLNLDYKESEKKEKCVHEQEDGIIYAVCATGTSGKDSLLSWIRLLQQHGNPIIGDLAVLFRFRKTPQEVVPFSNTIQPREEVKNNS